MTNEEVGYAYEIARVDFKDKSIPKYGVATGFGSDGTMRIDNYDSGFPQNIIITGLPRWGIDKENFNSKAIKISPEEFIEHLSKCKDIINPKLGTNDLAAAAWASRQYYIKGVIEKVKQQSREDSPHYGSINAPSPKTGVYVICESTNCLDWDRCSSNPSEGNLEGLIIIPKIPIRNVAAVVQHFYPEKFGSVIPNTNGVSFSRGNVMNRRYFAYEIPKSFTSLVLDKPHNSIKAFSF